MIGWTSKALRLILAQKKVHDDNGKPCNLLKVPVTSNTTDRAHTPLVEATERQDDGPVAPGQHTIMASGPKSLLPNVFRDKQLNEAEQRSRTPIKQVAEVAAEVADTAATLDKVSSFWQPLRCFLSRRSH